jgi:hypothetical protein
MVLELWLGNILFYILTFILIAVGGQLLLFGRGLEYEITSSIHPYLVTGAVGLTSLFMLIQAFGTVHLDSILSANEVAYFSSVFVAGSVILYLVSGEMNSAAVFLASPVLLLLGNLGLLIAFLFPGPWVGNGSTTAKAVLLFLGPLLVIVGFLIFVYGVSPFDERIDDSLSVYILGLGAVAGIGAVWLPWVRVVFTGLTVLAIGGGTLVMTYILTDILTDPRI